MNNASIYEKCCPRGVFILFVCSGFGVLQCEHTTVLYVKKDPFLLNLKCRKT